MDDVLLHIVKILYLFHHVFIGLRPVFVPIGQKNDMFFTLKASAKEVIAFNASGYFGNDYLFMKLYDSVRTSIGSYKVINI